MNKFGIGGSNIEAELKAIKPFTKSIKPIQEHEYITRIDKACKLMQAQNTQVVYLHAGTNLLYFTGMQWHPSERMVGALLFKNGDIHYIAPQFEKNTILDFMVIEGTIHCWEEHESPFELFNTILKNEGIQKGDILIDESTPFFVYEGISKETLLNIKNAKPIISTCRMIKSNAEIAIIQALMEITLEVHKATARILRIGITAKEVENFIHEAHKRYGIQSGSYFCIVLFGVDSAFPHGVKSPKPLELNDIVLVDTGCSKYNYISDITRTYIFGDPNNLQRNIWNIEKETQFAAYKASQLGNTCGAIDDASRKTLESHNLGPGYKLPGLPHRTGHGIGLNIHEYPYIVKNNNTILEPGMCFSNEPMICVPNKFGIRLEDHIYMTDKGPKWFTQPAHSIENPFGLKA